MNDLTTSTALGAPGTAGPLPSGNRWAVLAVLCASLLLAGIDLTVLHVAVPTLTSQLLPSASQLLWIVDIYPLTVAALLVTFGTLADRFGRKRLVLSGLVVFGLASVGAAFSVTPTQLIFARGLLGVGAGMYMAATVAIIRQVFPNPRERALAIGVWTAANSVGAAAGPAIGGLALERWWWGAIFLVNVPIVIAAVCAGIWLIPESRDSVGRSWDAASAVISILGLFAVVYALKRFADQMWLDPVALAVGGAGLFLTAVFVRRQRRSRSPLLDLTLFHDRRFAISTLCVLVCFGSYATLLFFASQLLQLVAGYAPAETGFALIPLAVANAAGAVLAPPLARRFHQRWVISGAMCGFAAGFLGLAVTFASPSAAVSAGATSLAAWLVLSGLSAGIVMTLGADIIMSTAHPDKAGAAGAIQETSFELGAGLGIAVFGAVLTVTYRLTLPALPHLGDSANTQVRESLGAALEVAPHIGQHGVAAARQAFTQGLAATSVVAAGCLLAAGVLAAGWLRRKE